MGPNARKCRAGLESTVVDAEPPMNGRRLTWSGAKPKPVAPVHRGNGMGTCGRFLRQRGRPERPRGQSRPWNAAIGRRAGRESERPTVPMKPLKGGGGIGPYFR
jgi:hypothetical protein